MQNIKKSNSLNIVSKDVKQLDVIKLKKSMENLVSIYAPVVKCYKKLKLAKINNN